MRKVVLFIHTSLDGYVQGKDPWDLGWISYNAELEHHAADVLSTASTVLFGRVTYMGMAGHWRSVPSNPDSSEYELRHAAWLERTEKVIFSRTPQQTDWNNTRFVSENLTDSILTMKQAEGGDIVLMGSPGVAHTLIEHDLIDEYKLTVSPIALGGGTRLFPETPNRTPLKLSGFKTFESGVLGLTYAR